MDESEIFGDEVESKGSVLDEGGEWPASNRDAGLLAGAATTDSSLEVIQA